MQNNLRMKRNVNIRRRKVIMKNFLSLR